MFHMVDDVLTGRILITNQDLLAESIVIGDQG